MDNTTQTTASAPSVSTEAQAAPVQTQTPEAQQSQTTQPTTQSNQSFSQNFDPNGLPAELQQGYKQMQADYTRKMQELSTERAKYDKYANLLPIVEEMTKREPQQQAANPVLTALDRQLKEAGYSDEAIEQGKLVAQTILNHFDQQQSQQRVLSTVQTAFADAVREDPRLNDQSLVYDLGDGKQATFGQIVEKLVGSNPNWHQDANGNIKEAIKTVDAMINSAKTQGKQELSDQAKQKAKTYAPTQSSSQGTQADGALNLRDAIAKAMQAS